ncbi:MgtC/SapB family protein [Microterricola pindariensis]|uniref:MgtC/SapB/SrpB/YhiD N-terminal domain-containing protein n=1 Tax=Microterricola pindariensis TaxID=478010 RepID=A0ABX5ARK1_9MICO|nr:MgtC/SapB family protein [Microterricola pindariensis]PPL14825.1 hypothetical protein GY24_15405 [Microterricola pindariensis]
MTINWFTDTLVTEMVLLGLAFVLSAVIGLERLWHRKSTGLRTHTLVGVGSALFTLVSAYGFSQVTDPNVVVDPSRIAAQVVSGIGFLGAGVIFVRQNVVNGLTTAASIWMTAAVGMACGAGMPVLASAATVMHLFTTTLLSRFGRRLRPVPEDTVVVQYKGGREVLSEVLAAATSLGLRTSLTSTKTVETPSGAERIEAVLTFDSAGRRAQQQLLQDLSGIRGVVSVALADEDSD